MNIRSTKEMQVYLINIRHNLCKFYNSTVKIEYIITNTIIYILSLPFMSMNSVVCCSTMCTFKGIGGLRFLLLVGNSSKSFTNVELNDFQNNHGLFFQNLYVP